MEILLRDIASLDKHMNKIVKIARNGDKVSKEGLAILEIILPQMNEGVVV